ncbi:TetR/AcrR family transcriptional regulator [Lederbergia sp. NSJ-179]|uniref:TetR/AcrR family transcriptional regulator n=1 Tax=Lederbergia sp. NSJ-179 TaxID=2931402 RepID=UPI001FD09637|nr:TetR/AcrR family transcriptional regulator [Lederbergia sp. NSJ-179]MCJ7842685.1 TetR/AcrR family transcriptional regulator [Lederbergia sp. NSJ-179]
MTKDKIIKAAIHQYSMVNYHGATMQKIAKEVGIKPASIYFFYKNKEDLFFAAFQKLLESHFKQMKGILDKAKDRGILEVFQSLLTGTVAYHKSHMQETNAYISLVASPPAEMKHFLQEHMETFDTWMFESLVELAKRDFPHLTETEAKMLTKQFVLLMDGIFWEINLYDEHTLQEQIDQANKIMATLLEGIQHEK